MSVVGDDSLLNPIFPGLINNVSLPAEITSAMTPAPGVGSAPCALLESLLLAAELTYTLTQAACEVAILYNM